MVEVRLVMVEVRLVIVVTAGRCGDSDGEIGDKYSGGRVCGSDQVGGGWIGGVSGSSDNDNKNAR